ncbi:RNA polymerase Rpc34 [Lipomyces kononenkoae]|uniref:RNA polymerase Rpc34 n=1 Tax=Lipomyces kononenkoae TaxID=34357 RepID=A0ACC3SWD9_LIPKO
MPALKAPKASSSARAASQPYAMPLSPPASSSSSSGSMHLLENVSQPAQTMYNKMINSMPDGHIYTQSELTELVGISDPLRLMGLIQENMNMGLVKMLHQGDDLCYQAIKKEDAEKIQSMTKDEAMVYSYIESSGTEGIWTKTIKAKTNLHQSVVQRCLKSLESKRYIKNIKSVKYPTRKIYMLASLQPSIDVTGGPWFTDSELDTEFISSLLSIVFRYIMSESFPTEEDRGKVPQPASKKTNGKVTKNKKKGEIVYDQLSYPANYRLYPSITQIHEFIRTSGITTVELAQSDIKALLDVLIYDGKIETIDHGMTYRAILGATVDDETSVQASEFDSIWSYGPFL